LGVKKTPFIAQHKEAEEEVEPVYPLNQCRQWQALQTGMLTNPSSFFPPSKYNSQQYSRAER